VAVTLSVGTMTEAKRRRVRRGEKARRSGHTLPERLAALEQRVETLEQQLAELRPRRAEPKAAEPPDPRPRCPGCRLPVDAITRGQCPWCGFHFEAVAQVRKLQGR